RQIEAEALRRGSHPSVLQTRVNFAIGTLAHVPEKACPALLMRGGTRFSDKDMRKPKKTGAHPDSSQSGCALAQCGLIRAEAGWPPTLKRLPVSVTSVPSTLKIEKSWSR